jgi:hypothetical protein
MCSLAFLTASSSDVPVPNLMRQPIAGLRSRGYDYDWHMEIGSQILNDIVHELPNPLHQASARAEERIGVTAMYKA